MAKPTGHPQYQQPTAQQKYPMYDRRESAVLPPSNQYPPQQAPQRTGSWNAAPSAPPSHYNQQPSYPSNEPTPQQQHQQQPPPQAQLTAPSAPDSVGTTPTADPSASFYFNSQPQQQTQQPSTSPPDSAPSPYPNLAQPMHSYQPSLPQTPASVAAQLSLPQQPHQAPTQQPQQPYWQHSAAQQTTLPPVWQPQPNATYAGYNQESFPSAPQHAPKQPVVEESLIDL